MKQVFVFFIFFYSFSARAGQEPIECSDRIFQELSESSVDSGEIRDLRISAQIRWQEFSECLQNEDPESCVSAGLQPSLKGLATPVSAVVSSFIATTALYPLNLLKMRAQTGLPISGGPFSGFGPYAVALGVSRLDYPIYDALREKGWSIHEAGITSALVLSLPSSPLWVYHTKRSLRAVAHDGVSKSGDSPAYNIRCYLREFRVDPRVAFRGQVMGMACVFPHAFQFQLMEYIHQRLFPESTDGDEEFLAHSSQRAISASMARVALIAVYPLDVLRVNRQSSGLSYPEISKMIWNERGVLGFYRGAPISILKQILWTFINRMLYDEMRKQFDS